MSLPDNGSFNTGAAGSGLMMLTLRPSLYSLQLPAASRVFTCHQYSPSASVAGVYFAVVSVPLLTTLLVNASSSAYS